MFFDHQETFSISLGSCEALTWINHCKHSLGSKLYEAKAQKKQSKQLTYNKIFYLRQCLFVGSTMLGIQMVFKLLSHYVVLRKVKAIKLRQ